MLDGLYEEYGEYGQVENKDQTIKENISKALARGN